MHYDSVPRFSETDEKKEMIIYERDSEYNPPTERPLIEEENSSPFKSSIP